jgi:hypothetical protein
MACDFCKCLIEHPTFTGTLPELYRFSIFAVVKSTKTNTQSELPMDLLPSRGVTKRDQT